jgi:hypothetical protein
VNRLLLLLPALACLPFVARDEPLHPVGHDREGLPRSEEPLRVYDAEPSHPLNRLHALLYIAERRPDEVGASLPAERRRAGLDDAAFFQGKWYFGMRKGAEVGAGDLAVFGGDVRVSPVEDLGGNRGARLRELLEGLATREQVAAVPELANPLARLLLQWDLLFVWWRVEQSGAAEPATLVAMARAIRALAQDREVLAGLEPGVDALRAAVRGTATDRGRPYFPAGLMAEDSAWREVARDEKALFHATRSLRAARIFVRGRDATETERWITEAGAATDAASMPDLGPGAEAALVMSLVGLDENLEPCATPVVDELRIRAITGPAELRPDNGSSRDGLSHWIFLRSRAQSLLGGAQPFRFVPDTAQSLFLEYGTAKHTTYFAQCALCHRLTNTGGQDPAGVKALGRYAQPRLETEPGARLRLAERQFAPIAAKLRERLAAAD